MEHLHDRLHRKIREFRHRNDSVVSGYHDFFFTVFLRLFSVTTYNSAVRMVLINQIYFTSIQILPLFFVVSICFGVISLARFGQYLRDLGLFDYFGHMLMGFVVTEFAPFITVLLIALRSGSAINTEIAVMKVNRNLIRWRLSTSM